MQTVGIFRNQLFRRSEPFIADQAQQFRRFKVMYLGRERSSPAPANSMTLSLADVPGRGSAVLRLWHVLSRDPSLYLRFLNGRHPDLIHAHFGVDAVYALPLAMRLSVPLVTTFHGYDASLSIAGLLRSAKPAWWNYALRRRGLARRGALFLCVSEYIRRRVVALGFPESRTRVHYIGVDVDTIRPCVKRFDRPVVLHVARLVEKKGTTDLIAAFAQLLRKVPDAELLIVGEGPLERRLRAQVEALGIGHAIRFLGALPHRETLELIGQSWVFALPSVEARNGDAEGLGMVLLEAAASGVPSVATRHGGIPEVVVDGETGRLCAERDTEALTDALVGLLRDDQLRLRLGQAARERVQREFDLRCQSAVLEGLYADLLGGA